MKKTKKYNNTDVKKNVKFNPLWVAILILFLGVCVYIANSFLDQLGKSELHRRYKKTQLYIEKNHTSFADILTKTFDSASTCTLETYVCQIQNKENIYKYIKNTEELDNFSSTYFIRLSDDNMIEKLFLSGEYKKEKVDTWNERKVARFLKSNKDQLMGIYIDESYSNMRYLKDLYSEAEVIVPVKVNGKTVGAVVRLHGT
ncbi:MAG TPA: hypothetical protein VK338_05875 [Candidatus Nitrosocosmicus sp.]|nr:hypothetical protein [Candidatus Nitrosocosmicus sp.]